MLDAPFPLAQYASMTRRIDVSPGLFSTGPLGTLAVAISSSMCRELLSVNKMANGINTPTQVVPSFKYLLFLAG